MWFSPASCTSSTRFNKVFSGHCRKKQLFQTIHTLLAFCTCCSNSAPYFLVPIACQKIIYPSKTEGKTERIKHLSNWDLDVLLKCDTINTIKAGITAESFQLKYQIAILNLLPNIKDLRLRLMTLLFHTK